MFFLSNGYVTIGTITSEISFGCQANPHTSGLVRDNQIFLRGYVMVPYLKTQIPDVQYRGNYDP